MPSDELRCAEYCFQCRFNPLQHPSFDDNMHHLDALLTALSNSCGGLVFLTAAEITSHKTIQFSTFNARKVSTSDRLEKSQLAVPANVWSVTAVRKSAKTIPYELEDGDVQLKFDMQGKMQYLPLSGEDVFDNPAHGTERCKPKPDIVPNAALTEVSQPFTKVSWVDDVASSELPVVVSELNWDQNKGWWWNILRESDISIDECISLCDFLEPHIPMQLLPDKDSLRHLFPSDATCDEALYKVATKEPGFAIASRSWLSLLPDDELLEPPSNHLCDILTVSKIKDSKPNICLWVVVSGSKKHIIWKQIQYMFVVGRAIKHQIVNQGKEVPSLTVRCMLHSTNEEDNPQIESTIHEAGINKTQDSLCYLFLDENTFDVVKRGIARLLLSQKSHINNCAGEQLSVKLSANQAQTLLKIKKNRVSYVSSAPGTGKTLCALALYEDFGKELSVYICPTEPLLQYLTYNGCEATLVKNDGDLYRGIKQGTFDNKKCVIIDESHHLRC